MFNKIRNIALFILMSSSLLLTGCYDPPFQVDDTPALNVDIQQNVVVDHNNSSTTNLNAGIIFTGTSTSTLGIVGIQVTLNTDQNCAVYVDQSPDGINWDITDSFNYYSSLGGNGWTTQAQNSFVRVRVKNLGIVATTHFRLQTCLCPIVEAVPRALNSEGRLKVDATLSDGYGFNAEITPFNELRIAEAVKLAGTVFIGNTLDTNFVTVNTTGAGTVTQTGGQMLLQTNGINGYAEAFSSRRGRFIAGESNMAKLVIQVGDIGVANNTRRWGIGDLPGSGNFTITDGAFFKLSGTTFSVATLKGGIETLVTSGNFNGVIGSTYTLDTNVHVYEIYYSPYKVYFSLDGQLLHTVSASTTTWTNTVSLYVGMDNQNTAGLATNHILYCRAFSISRLGQLRTAPIYKHITTTTTTICKYGAGTLHGIFVNNPVNSTITIYDNTSAAGTVIAVISSLSNTQPFYLPYEADFYTGLTVVTGGNFDITLIYE